MQSKGGGKPLFNGGGEGPAEFGADEGAVGEEDEGLTKLMVRCSLSPPALCVSNKHTAYQFVHMVSAFAAVVGFRLH